MPKLYREDEQPIDAEDIRKILLAVEALTIRVTDCDFSVGPTKIHIRKEYAKTRVARDIIFR